MEMAEGPEIANRFTPGVTIGAFSPGVNFDFQVLISMGQKLPARDTSRQGCHRCPMQGGPAAGPRGASLAATSPIAPAAGSPLSLGFCFLLCSALGGRVVQWGGGRARRGSALLPLCAAWERGARPHVWLRAELGCPQCWGEEVPWADSMVCTHAAQGSAGTCHLEVGQPCSNQYRDKTSWEGNE